MVKEIYQTDTLMLSVGALPRTVTAGNNGGYNLTWSIDGLVNEYIKPCRIRLNNKITEIQPLREISKVILDSNEYQSSHTSGGIGSLVKELDNVPNVSYQTLRYPGHYEYVREIINYLNSDFDKIKEIFLEKFPYTNDDVIIVYAEAIGKDAAGAKIRRSFYNKFYGTNGLTGIQATTAASGVAILELMLFNKISGIINHSNVTFADFTATRAYERYYKKTLE